MAEVNPKIETEIYQDFSARGFGSSREDVNSYAETAGSAAASTACIAYGAAPAAPLCGEIGGLVAGWLADGLQQAVTNIIDPQKANRERKKAFQKVAGQIDPIAAKFYASVNGILDYAIRSLAYDLRTITRLDGEPSAGPGGWINIIPWETVVPRELQKAGAAIVSGSHTGWIPDWETILPAGGLQAGAFEKPEDMFKAFKAKLNMALQGAAVFTDTLSAAQKRVLARYTAYAAELKADELAISAKEGKPLVAERKNPLVLSSTTMKKKHRSKKRSAAPLIAGVALGAVLLTRK